MKIKILSSTDGDWEALYIDGKKVDEGHSLQVVDVLVACGLTVETKEVECDAYNCHEAFPDEVPTRKENR